MKRLPGGLTMMAAVCLFAGCSGLPSDERSIREVLDRQVAAWNRGDIDGFMEGYWKSDDLEFRSPARTNRGWNTTRAAFRARYDTREKMGHLEFVNLDIQPRDAKEATVSGEFRLTRDSEAGEQGSFELLFRKIDGRWLIVRDETKSEQATHAG